MKNGKLSKREAETLQRAVRILNGWCDWENDERETEGFDPILDDVECSAASAAGLIQNFLFECESVRAQLSANKRSWESR